MLPSSHEPRLETAGIALGHHNARSLSLFSRQLYGGVGETLSRCLFKEMVCWESQRARSQCLTVAGLVLRTRWPGEGPGGADVSAEAGGKPPKVGRWEDLFWRETAPNSGPLGQLWVYEASRAVVGLLPLGKVNPMPLATCPSILHTAFLHLVPTWEGGWGARDTLTLLPERSADRQNSLPPSSLAVVGRLLTISWGFLLSAPCAHHTWQASALRLPGAMQTWGPKQRKKAIGRYPSLVRSHTHSRGRQDPLHP